MDILPICKWRGSRLPDGTYPCGAIQLIDDTVTADICRKCPYADKDPLPVHVKAAEKRKLKQLPSEPRKLILTNDLSPGDVTVMSGAIYSLHKLYPGQYVTAVKTTADAVYEHNPYITKLSSGEVIKTGYTDGVNNCDKRPLHFLQAYCDDLGKQLGIALPCQTNRPMLYLSEEEKSWVSMPEEHKGWKGRYWVMGAGSWKSDYTSKKYYRKGLQKVIDHYQGKIQFVQVGTGGNEPHYTLNRCINFIGKTDHRMLIRLVAHPQCAGVLCLESWLHHLAAAFRKPCVTLASGLFPLQWLTYPTGKILHNQGALPCCRETCCWKSRVIPLGDGSAADKSLCELPLWVDGEAVPKCQFMTRPADIIRALETFRDGLY